MGKKNLLKSTSKKKSTKAKKTSNKAVKAAPKKKAAAKKAKAKPKAAKKKAAPAKKKKTLTLKELLMKKFDTTKPETVVPFKKEPAGQVISAPAFFSSEDAAEVARIKSLLTKTFDLSAPEPQPEPAADIEEKPATPPEPVSIADLLKKQFDVVLPANLYTAPKTKPDAGETPPFVSGLDPADTERVRKLLFKTFDLSEPEVKPEAPAPEEKAPEPVAEPEAPAAEEKAPEPVAEPEAPAAEEKAPEPVAEPEAPAAEEKTPEPVAEPEAPAAEEKTPEPVTEPEAPAAEEKAPEPVAEPEAPAAEEKAPEPVAEPEAPAAEEKAPEPVAEPEAPAAEEKAPEPVTEPEAPAAEEKAPEPVAESPVTPAKPARPLPIGMEFPEPPPVPTLDMIQSEQSRTQAASVPKPKKEMDPMMKTAIGACSAVAAIFILLLIASFANTTNYYLTDNDGVVEVWQGKFAPMGTERIAVLSGIAMPETVKDEYSKAEVGSLIVENHLKQADDLLATSGLPDFDNIRGMLVQALPYASDSETRENIKRRLNRIDLMALLYKSDISVFKGSPADLENAKDYLTEAATLATEKAETTMIQEKLKLIDERLSAASPK